MAKRDGGVYMARKKRGPTVTQILAAKLRAKTRRLARGRPKIVRL